MSDLDARLYLVRQLIQDLQLNIIDNDDYRSLVQIEAVDVVRKLYELAEAAYNHGMVELCNIATGLIVAWFGDGRKGIELLLTKILTALQSMDLAERPPHNKIPL
jgi:hypothetical protein